jgi:hypothetical protein
MSQGDKSTRPSPPAEVKAEVNGTMVSVNYSSPSVKERAIWGELVPYGKVWRTGANEATVIETSGDIMVNELTLPAGKYSLFTIPGEKEWTFIFNSVWDQWGHYKYESSKDVLRVTAVPQKSSEFHEKLTFDIMDNVLILSWENLTVGLGLR